MCQSAAPPSSSGPNNPLARGGTTPINAAGMGAPPATPAASSNSTWAPNNWVSGGFNNLPEGVVAPSGSAQGTATNQAYTGSAPLAPYLPPTFEAPPNPSGLVGTANPVDATSPTPTQTQIAPTTPKGNPGDIFAAESMTGGANGTMQSGPSPGYINPAASWVTAAGANPQLGVNPSATWVTGAGANNPAAQDARGTVANALMRRYDPRKWYV